MATSFIKKSMAYLGLVDDYDDYDDYDNRPAPMAGRRPVAAEPEEEVPSPSSTTGRIRVTAASGSGGPVAAAPQVVPPRPATSPSVKISTPDAGARVHIVSPARFADAVEIANRLMNNQPVIVNMQTADRDLQRRMIDFCSGATYALSGGMERVADEVFLLTPSNVKVSDEERQRLADHGLVNP
ncbi:MAG: cell division protein SepF [Acidimicrobiales bacterium]|jgi:cell division inhibitor SepF